MPTYSYRCTECGNAFDVVQSFTDDSLTVCPVCQGTLRKVFSPVGVTFNGSGFYRTDSRGGSGSSSGSAASPEKKSAGGGGATTGSGTSSSGSSGSSGGSSSGAVRGQMRGARLRTCPVGVLNRVHAPVRATVAAAAFTTVAIDTPSAPTGVVLPAAV